MGVGPGSNRYLSAVGDLALRPDITNLTTRELYEVKPRLYAAAGAAQVALYAGAFASASVTVMPGSPTARGTSGVVPAPGGHYIFHGLAPGVIVYQYRRGAYGRAPARDPVLAGSRAPVDSRSRATAAARSYWDYLEKATGLTGTALALYLIVSEGSRIVIPPAQRDPRPVITPCCCPGSCTVHIARSWRRPGGW